MLAAQQGYRICINYQTDDAAAHEVLAQDPAEVFYLPRSEALPVTYILDEKGKVRATLMGEQTAAGVLAKIKELRGA